MSKEQAIPLIIILIYIIIILILGILPYGKKRIDTAREFHSATENTGSFVIFLCLMATLFTSSTWTVWVSLTADTGIFAAYCMVYMTSAGILYYFITQRVYSHGQASGIITMAGFFLEKYNNKPLAYVVAIISILNACVWIIMEITTMGAVVNVVFNNQLSPIAALSIGLLVVLVYIIWGGLESVIWTSCFQGIIISAGGICLCVILFVYFFDSFSTFTNSMSNHMQYLTIEMDIKSETSIYRWASYTILGSVGCICLPQVFSRMAMGRNLKVQKRAAIGFVFSGLWCVFFVIIGFIAIAANLEGDGSQPLIFFMVKITENPYLLGFTYILLMSASMATLDITLLSVSTILTMDVFQNIFKNRNIKFSQYKYVTLSRLIIILFAVICMAVALFYNDQLIKLAFKSYEVIVQLFPLLIFACYSKACNGKVAGLALAIGFLVLVFLTGLRIYPLGFTAGVWGLVANSSVIIIYLLLRRKRSKKLYCVD